MIVYQKIMKDFAFHYVLVFLFTAALRSQFKMTHHVFLFSTLAATFVITYLNHRYFPQLAITRFLNAPQEAFQDCTRHRGVQGSNCGNNCGYKRGVGF
jgi:hypothetical protein